jgi:hypothetical protein
MPANNKINRLFIYLIYLACAVLLLIDLFIPRHGYFEFESLPGFFVVLGAIGYIVIIMASRLLRKLVSRNEDYYD